MAFGDRLPVPANPDPSANRDSNTTRVMVDAIQVLAHLTLPSGIYTVYTCPEQTYTEVREIRFGTKSGTPTFDMYIIPPGGSTSGGANKFISAMSVGNVPISCQIALHPGWSLAFQASVADVVNLHISGVEVS